MPEPSVNHKSYGEQFPNSIRECDKSNNAKPQMTKLKYLGYILISFVFPFASCNPGNEQLSLSVQDPLSSSYCDSISEPVLDKKEFSFAVCGDSQVAYYEEGTIWNTEELLEKFTIVKQRLRDSIELLNRLQPDFALTLGDNVHAAGQWVHFRVFVDVVSDVTIPLYLVMGNHDWGRGTALDRENIYGTTEFGNFLWAQQEINGFKLGWYSFDAGDWHFIMWSQPGVDSVDIDWWMEQYPQFLDWLEQDLDANQNRPIIFVTHHPLLPVGRTQFEYYGLNPGNRRKLVELITRYGNVRYALFGHVHNTIASIPLISWRFKGITFLVLPNSSNTVRAYDYLETYQSSWGVTEFKINGSECEGIKFHSLSGEEIEIDPESLPYYKDQVYGYLLADHEIPIHKTVINGGFEDPLEGAWFVNHLLPYGQTPMQRRMLIRGGMTDEGRYLYLYVKANRQNKHRLRSEVRQAIQIGHEDWIRIRLKYLIESKAEGTAKNKNLYIQIAAYKDGTSRRLVNLFYNIGSRPMGENPPLWNSEFAEEDSEPLWLQSTPVYDEWTELILNPKGDYTKYVGDWNALGMDHLVLRVGVSTRFQNKINFSPSAQTIEIGAGIDDILFEKTRNRTGPSPGFVRMDWAW